jgi:C-terminal processing protease CtpA/Prc
MKYSFLPALILFLLPVWLAAQPPKPAVDSFALRTFRQADLQSDFNFLRKALEETHPGLYRYTSKEVMTARLDSFYRQVKDNMPFYDYYKLLSALVSNVRCSHSVILPEGDWQGFTNKGQQFFPFAQHTINDRMYVTLNETTDTSIKPGYEIMSINGMPIGQVYRIIFAHVWGDGYLESLKRQTLNNGFFPFFYYLYVDRPSQYLVTFKDLSGKPVSITVPALTNKDMQTNALSNPVNKEILRLYGGKKTDRDFRILKDSNTVIMKIKGFGGNADGGLDKYLEKSMKKLKDEKIGNLVIDLRYNGGGWDSSGVLLFTYLISKPSVYYRRHHTITDSSEYIKYSDIPKETLANLHNELKKEPDGTFSLQPQYTAGLPLQYPKTNHYTGKIYFLMNGGSGSTTSEFIAAAEGNDLGVFIGEESGGCHEGGNGGTFLHLKLPVTKISVTTPLVYYDNGGKPAAVKGRGTMPDYPVWDDMQLLLVGRDAQLEFVKKLIMSK